MSDTPCVLAAEAKLETPEGALTVKSLSGKSTPVFTRENGKIRFRLMQDVRLLAEGQPVLKVTLENGQSFRLGTNQMLPTKDGREIAAQALEPGTELIPLAHYREGYEYRDDASGETRTSSCAWRVRSVEPAGTADLYTLRVKPSDCFFLSAGVLCLAE